jgi:hypothetical protein
VVGALPSVIAGDRSAGGNDPFGRPGQFPPLPHEIELVVIPAANHTFGTRTGVPYSAA